ncbi:MAG: glycosyl hydrolase 53 family protein [Saprospiraceae bacterium]|nr:glycosyl hydrolase 53 family protein [Saprospiraceae bacterium]
MRYRIFVCLGLLCCCVFTTVCTQEPAPPDNTPETPLYLGADLSYVNEMEDCGVVYQENGQPKDPYRIFADKGCNLVRLRLWHSPSWYDTLNQGKRYSDFQDLRKSIQRAKALSMPVLLDFHLSDQWSDPAHQLVPAAWLGVVDQLPALKDSVFNYVQQTLLRLHAENLLPEMVQIGNETNREILLSPAANASSAAIHWDRNATLFNAGIQAVRAVEKSSGKKIQVAVHIAGPANALAMVNAFKTAGVTDFDLIGLSYYWAWHKTTTLAQTGSIIAQLKVLNPEKAVMIFETGYIWTTASNDQANNIISEVHPDYAPASPENQRKWLVDLTKEVKKSGGIGVLYWEPAWVSSGCRTQWGQGSHQEHAAFFDFSSNVLPAGGMGWMAESY